MNFQNRLPTILITKGGAILPTELLDRAVPQGAYVRPLGITVSDLVHVQAASRAIHEMRLLDEILNQQ
jgi:hypothetical protein